MVIVRRAPKARSRPERSAVARAPAHIQYGGGAAVSDGTVFFANFADNGFIA
jgi:hypothetical protein